MHPSSAFHRFKIILYAYLLLSILNINVLAELFCGDDESPQGPPLYSDCLAVAERIAPRPSFKGTHLLRPEMFVYNSCTITVLYLANPGAFGLKTEYTSTDSPRIWMALRKEAKEVIQQCIGGPRSAGSGFLSKSIVFEGRGWEFMLKVFKTPVLAPPPDPLAQKTLSIDMLRADTTSVQWSTASGYSVGVAMSSAAPRGGPPRPVKGSILWIPT